MDRSQRIPVAVLAALLLAVGGVLAWQSDADPEPPDTEATAPVWALDASEAVAVTLSRRDDDVRLAQRDGSWWLDAPSGEVEADRDQVAELLGVLEDMRRGIPVEPPDGDLAPFGLADPPQTRVEVILSDGSIRTLDIGTDVPVTFRTYVRGADGGVVAVNGEANGLLQQEARRFRDHRMFRFDPADVRRVVIEGPEGVLSVHGQGHDWWVDGFTRAEPDRVDDLVLGLLDLRFIDVLPLGDPIADPVYTTTVTLADGTSSWLRVGESTPLGRVVGAADGRLGMMLEDLVRQLGRGPTDVGIQRAFGVRMDRADQVSATFGDRRLVATRDGPAWSAEGLAPGSAWDAVQQLADVGLTYTRHPPDAPEAWGRVEVTEGDRIRRVVVGEAADDGLHRAVDLDGGAAFHIPAADLAAALDRFP